MVNAKLLKIATKTVGVISLAMIGYDSHEAAKIRASAYSKNHKAESLSERYMDDLKLESPSTIRGDVKKGLFRYCMDENLTGFFTSVAGYFDGFGSMLVRNVVPLTLAGGTLVGKGLFSKMCGAGLIAFGGIFLLQEMFGIGKHK